MVFNDSAAGTTTVSISGNVSPSSVTFNNNTLSYTLTGASGIAGFTGLAINGSGAVTIANSNSYTGGTTLNAGRLNLANAAALGAAAGTFAINGGTLANAAGGPLTLPNYPIAWNGSFTFAGNGAQGSLNLGAGNVTLGGSRDAVYLSGGTLGMSGIGDKGLGYGLHPERGGPARPGRHLPPIGDRPSSTAARSAWATAAAGPRIGGTGGVALAANTTLVFNHADAATFAGAVSGSGTVFHTGGGTLLLGGASSYTGGTTINAGTVQLGNNAGLAPPRAVSPFPRGGLLDLNGYSPSIGAFNGNGLIDNVSAGGAPVLTIGNGGASGTFSGTIQNTTGALALVKTGAGTQFLSGTNTYTGGTQINGGSPQRGYGDGVAEQHGQGFGQQQPRLQRARGNLGRIVGQRQRQPGATALTVGANNANSLYSGSLGGGGGLTKTGSGTLALTGVQQLQRRDEHLRRNPADHHAAAVGPSR